MKSAYGELNTNKRNMIATLRSEIKWLFRQNPIDENMIGKMLTTLRTLKLSYNGKYKSKI
jgi:hypothetical protein